MREIRPSGSEGGVALTPPLLPLSCTSVVFGGPCSVTAASSERRPLLEGDLRTSTLPGDGAQGPSTPGTMNSRGPA